MRMNELKSADFRWEIFWENARKSCSARSHNIPNLPFTSATLPAISSAHLCPYSRMSSVVILAWAWRLETWEMRLLIIMLLFPFSLGCQRQGRQLLIAQERSAKDIIQGLKNDFDMNVHFGLRKMGINRRTGNFQFSERSFLGFWTPWKCWQTQVFCPRPCAKTSSLGAEILDEFATTTAHGHFKCRRRETSKMILEASVLVNLTQFFVYATEFLLSSEKQIGGGASRV